MLVHGERPHLLAAGQLPVGEAAVGGQRDHLAVRGMVAGRYERGGAAKDPLAAEAAQTEKDNFSSSKIFSKNNNFLCVLRGVPDDAESVLAPREELPLVLGHLHVADRPLVLLDGGEEGQGAAPPPDLPGADVAGGAASHQVVGAQDERHRRHAAGVDSLAKNIQLLKKLFLKKKK